MIIILGILISLAVNANQVSLTPANTVVIRTAIDDKSMFKASMDLFALDVKRGKQTYPIYVVLDSPGGSIAAGQDFINFAKTVPNVKTVTIFAASMAAGIVQSLPGERLIVENGVLMFHRAKGGVDGQFEDGELESRLAFYKQWVRSLEQVNANRLQISLQDYKTKVVNELWIYSTDTIKQKAADKVVSLKCSADLVQQTDYVSIEFFLGSIELKFSKCPLFKLARPVNAEDQAKTTIYNNVRLKINAK